MKNHGFNSEAEVAAVAAHWLKSQGFECWFEVPCTFGRADIVACRGSVCFIVETKIGLTLALLDQLLERQHCKVNGVIAAVPGHGTRTRYAAERFIVQNDCGLLNVRPGGYGRMVHWPTMRRIDSSAFRAKLRPEYQTKCVPGTKGEYWTPFKGLVEQLQRELKEMPLKDAADLPCLKEYNDRAPAAQRRALTDYLDRDLIPGWQAERRGRAVWVTRKQATT